MGKTFLKGKTKNSFKKDINPKTKNLLKSVWVFNEASLATL
jgi:ABC-type oligopeptide transport system ATPase subunit